MKVAWLYVAPVKGLALEARDHIELGLSGVEDDRRFCLVGEDGHMLNGKRLAPVTTIGAHFDPATDHLELRMPDDTRVTGTVTGAEPIEVTMYGGHIGLGARRRRSVGGGTESAAGPADPPRAVRPSR